MHYRITVGLPEGLHARPSALLSSLLVDFASTSSAIITVKNNRDGSASADSTLELMLLAIQPGETLTISTDRVMPETLLVQVLELVAGTLTH